MADDSLDPSELGTKEYWSKIYKSELQNFNEFGDVGEIWFGVAAERRIIQWITVHQDIINTNSNIVDVGCGNGSLLICLAKKNFTNLTGVDYSEEAISLAKNISTEECVRIVFQQMDILEINPNLQNVFDLILDKGTFDAISLMKDSANSKRIYKENVCKLFTRDCSGQKLFVIASCNWTKDELVAFFKPEFLYFDELDAPTLQFGGKVGKNTDGVSMEPTIKSGQYLLAEHLSVKRQTLKRGDIVVFKSPVKPNEYMCKRLIGFEGDIVHHNVIVPKGHVWVEGDNKVNSIDSRDFGPVSFGLLTNKAIFRIWPVYMIGSLSNK